MILTVKTQEAINMIFNNQNNNTFGTRFETGLNQDIISPNFYENTMPANDSL